MGPFVHKAWKETLFSSLGLRELRAQYSLRNTIVPQVPFIAQLPLWWQVSLGKKFGVCHSLLVLGLWKSSVNWRTRLTTSLKLTFLLYHATGLHAGESMWPYSVWFLSSRKHSRSPRTGGSALGWERYKKDVLCVWGVVRSAALGTASCWVMRAEGLLLLSL